MFESVVGDRTRVRQKLYLEVNGLILEERRNLRQLYIQESILVRPYDKCQHTKSHFTRFGGSVQRVC